MKFLKAIGAVIIGFIVYVMFYATMLVIGCIYHCISQYGCGGDDGPMTIKDLNELTFKQRFDVARYWLNGIQEVASNGFRWLQGK